MDLRNGFYQLWIPSADEICLLVQNKTIYCVWFQLKPENFFDSHQLLVETFILTDLILVFETKPSSIDKVDDNQLNHLLYTKQFLFLLKSIKCLCFDKEILIISLKDR